LMLHALQRVPVQAIFDRDPYESRRTALSGDRRLHVLVAYQLVRQAGMRGVLRAIAEHAPLQPALGGPVARKTLANALTQRPVEQMVEAWMRVSQSSGAGVERLGKQCARIALVDSSPLKLSLAVYDWAQYRQASGAAKVHAVLEWARRLPAQVVVSAGKVQDANQTVQMTRKPGWTYVQDRGHVSFARLAQLHACGAPCVVRLKQGMQWRVLARRPVPLGPQGGGYLRGDQTVRLAGWPEVEVRVVSYQLPGYRWVRVVTDRFDLTASSVARLYKERWEIEHRWKGLKTMLKIKRPLGERATALPLQLSAAFVTDLLGRVCKACGHFPARRYAFVTRGQELSLVRLADIADGALRQALERIRHHFTQLPRLSQPPPLFVSFIWDRTGCPYIKLRPNRSEVTVYHKSEQRG
jgi:DDE family transposase